MSGIRIFNDRTFDNSSNSLSFQLPRIDITQVSPSAFTPLPQGKLALNVDNTIYYSDGLIWIPLASATGDAIWEHVTGAAPFGNYVRINAANPDYDGAESLLFGQQAFDPATGSRVMFDQPNSAFRAGRTTGTQWDSASRGVDSVAMGVDTIASGANSTIGGGIDNVASGPESTVAGGNDNNASADDTFIGGGEGNTASGSNSTVTGGNDNTSSGSDGFVGGGSSNTASGTGSTVCGGSTNGALSNNCFVGGGSGNSATASFATCAGGTTNLANGTRCFIGGGTGNTSLGGNSVTAGGSGNSTPGDFGVTCGGTTNTTSGISASIGGGASNTASGDQSCIPGGASNTASGLRSLCAGDTASDGGNARCFVWSGDASGITPGVGVLPAAAAGQFIAKAPGSANFISDAGNTMGVSLPAGGAAWAAISDRNRKDLQTEMDSIKILERVEKLPIYRYNYKGRPEDEVYIGPVAQDWHVLFPSSKDPLKIDTIDPVGVSLAAIKGLLEMVKELKVQLEEIPKLKREIEELKEMIQKSII